MAKDENLSEFFAKRIAKFTDRPAVTCLGQTLKYRDIDRLSDDFACFLHYCLHMEPGDRLAIQLPNLLQYPVVVLGAVKAGVVIVNTNPMYTARELEHQLNDAGVTAVVVLTGISGTLGEVIANTQVRHVILTQVGDLHAPYKRFFINGLLDLKERFKVKAQKTATFLGALKEGQGRELPRHLSVSESLAVLQYTGGTTGVSKGAMLTHANLIYNLRQVRVALGNALQEGREVIIAPLPIYHIFAFVQCMLLGFDLGARVVLIPDPRKTNQLVRTMKKVRFTFMVGLNTLFNALCRHRGFRQLDFRHLHLTISGGMALMRDTAETWEAVTGCKILEGYGLTEASPVVSVNPPDAPRLGTVGRLMPSTEGRLVDSQGEDVAPGEAGELWIRGPQVMRGYWRRPEATDEVLDQQGWLHTGDVAKFDEEGYLSIVDRIKDMIVVSGFNVYPNEVEDEISKHPDIIECAAVGVPDPETVEAVKLFVVASNPALTADEVRDFARRNLTGYKIPRQISFIDELPKTNVGKVLRRELRDRP